MDDLNPNAPCFWVGCMKCYNNGDLIGRWFSPQEMIEAFDTIGEETELVIDDQLAAVHRNCPGLLDEDCEEMWCYDVSGLPQNKEMSPEQALGWAEVYDDLGSDELWPALCSWVNSGYWVEIGNTGLPSISSFEEVYKGNFDSFEDYLREQAESQGMFNDWPEDAVRYFNFKAWAEDARHNYTVVDAPAGSGPGGVWVFENH